MSAFARLAREMLHERITLAWAVAFSFIAAAGLGIGLLSIVPVLELILDPEEGRSLVELARSHNATDPLIRVPGFVIAWLPADPFRGVLLLISILAGLSLVGAASNFFHLYFTGTVAARTVARIRQRAFERAVSMPLGRVIERGPSEFVARVVRDAAELQRGFISLTSKAVAQLIKGLAALAVAVVIQPALTFVAVPVALVLAVVLRRIGMWIRRGTRGSLSAQQRLLGIATESLQGLRAVKSSTGEAAVAGRFATVNADVVKHELRVRTGRAASSPVVETLAVLALGGLALFAAKLILDGALPFPQFIAALIALGVAGTSFRPLAGLVAEVHAADAPASRLCEILDEPAETRGGALPPLARHGRSVVFEDVHLTYPGSDHPALDGVSLELKHGERVALVGPNGSGKTTLVSLLPRLLVPDGGRVLVDGTDIASVSLPSLRGQIGVVTQETVLFRGTVAENIAFGLDAVGRDRITAAARRAHADEFITRLVNGYDADLAEQGASLSGGQRQRLAIARAILREPSILILDEATSHIDAESEARIDEAIADFCRGRTALIVAHRLTTMLRADRIVVMDRGRIVDEGTHEELRLRCPVYRRLVETQFVESGSPTQQVATVSIPRQGASVNEPS